MINNPSEVCPLGLDHCHAGVLDVVVSSSERMIEL